MVKKVREMIRLIEADGWYLIKKNNGKSNNRS